MKKLVFILAIAMIATGAYARDFVSPAGTILSPDGSTSQFNDKASQVKYENWEWPIDQTAYIPFVYQKLCQFDVFMDVGYWIQIDNCKDLKMKLKQMAINDYKGQVTVKISSNSVFKLQAVFDKDGGVDFGGDWKKDIAWTGGDDTYSGEIIGPGAGQSRTLTLTLTKVKLDKLVGGQNCLKVGTMTISVRPHVLLAGHVCWDNPCGQGVPGDN
jgi:hypothetical protein